MVKFNIPQINMGKRIRAARKLRGLSQRELHTKLSSSGLSSLSKWETGKVSISALNLYEISQALDIPIQWFYGEEY